MIIIDFLIAFYFFLRAAKFIKNSVTTVAKVAGVKANGTEFKFEYKDHLGRKMVSNWFQSQYKPMNTDEELEVIFERNNLDRVNINKKLSLFAIPFSLVITNFIILGFLLYALHDGLAKFPF